MLLACLPQYLCGLHTATKTCARICYFLVPLFKVPTKMTNFCKAYV